MAGLRPVFEQKVYSYEARFRLCGETQVGKKSATAAAKLEVNYYN